MAFEEIVDHWIAPRLVRLVCGNDLIGAQPSPEDDDD
jgi:hypothetical protein